MIEQIQRTIQERPLFLFQYVRSHWLFQRTRFVRAAVLALGLYPDGIAIGRSSRIQRLRCLRTGSAKARILVGEHAIVYENARIEAHGEGTIRIGDCAVIGDARIYCRNKVTIGARLLASWNVLIQDFDPHPLDPALRARQVEDICGLPAKKLDWDFSSEEIEIGEDVWLGANATVLKGAKIGAGCVVAAGAVVTAGDWPARSVLAGNPAKVVKTL
jgi:acetyltransferase-like isoleucine patch superfamily enzyme